MEQNIWHFHFKLEHKQGFYKARDLDLESNQLEIKADHPWPLRCPAEQFDIFMWKRSSIQSWDKNKQHHSMIPSLDSRRQKNKRILGKLVAVHAEQEKYIKMHSNQEIKNKEIPF